MQKLQGSLLKLEREIDKQELVNEAISKASVGWHIEHSLLTINLIIDTVQNSNSQHYKWKFSFPKLIVFATNKIPRGRARSPRAVVPVTYSAASLKDHVEKTKIKIKELELTTAGQYFEHPYFGHLQLKDTIKFLQIHTHHHLAIINDIIQSHRH